MNCIKLTNIQKLNLLVMCKKLFPEYNNIRFGKSILTTSKDYLYFHKIKNEMQVEIINIHWYEFCVLHLSKRIYTIGNEVMSGFLNFTLNVNYTKKHPLDYLYEEFLKLKL